MKHGKSKTRLYNIWKCMRQHCNNKHKESWCEILNLDYAKAHARLTYYKWPAERVFNTEERHHD